MSEYTYKASFNMTVEFVMENLEKYTFPNIRKQIQSVDIKNPIMAVSVTKDDNLVGLSISEFNSGQSHSEIFSFYIDPAHRNSGIGSELLKKTEQVLTQKGFDEVRCFIWSSWESSEATKRLLVKQGWDEPVKLMQIFKTDTKRVGSIPWKEDVELQENYEIIPWSWVSPEEKKQLLDEQAFSNFFPDYLSPFHNQDKIAFHPSLALKFNNKIIGWLMVYWNSADTLEYNNLFIKKEFRESLKVPMEMIRKASLLQIEQGVPNILWTVGHENPLLEQYFEKKFGNFGDKAIIYGSSKKLGF
ncbi:MAG: GNAT family N-acetyltransferase [Bacteroidales bacterium]|nr:GNAT family N-acetyltransferase [Bacteroidales bacterium]MCF8391626.1 GNAT family N-acetyltransferase [Bacteroidales bacterium]